MAGASIVFRVEVPGPGFEQRFRSRSRRTSGVSLGVRGLGFRGLGVSGLGFRGLGVSGLGFRGLEVSGLGFRGFGV